MKSSLVVSLLHFYRALWDLTNLKSAAMHWQIPIVWTINDWKPKLQGGLKGPKAISVRHPEWISDASSVDGPLRHSRFTHVTQAACWCRCVTWKTYLGDTKHESWPAIHGNEPVNPLPLQSTCRWKNALKNLPDVITIHLRFAKNPNQGWIAMA